jgi:hypothetical protein
VAFLVFASLMWALLLLGIDRDSWPQQIGAPIGATVFGLLLLGFYPLYRKDGD